MKKGITRTLFRGLAVCALATALFAAPALAQQPQPAPQPQAQDAPEIPEGELETFAEAYAEIAEIRTEMQVELQAADDSNQATQIQQQADQRMQQVLQEHEVSLERYQEITQILNADAEQRQAFQEILEEVQGGV